MVKVRASAEQLFKGQQTHRLSQEEIATLYKQIRLFTHPAKNKNLAGKRLHQIIKTLNQTPSGALALRNILKSGKILHIDLVGRQKNIPQVNAYFNSDRNFIHINEEFLGDRVFSAIYTAHECIHGIQKRNESPFEDISAEVLDAETQALSEHLAFEHGAYPISDAEFKETIAFLQKENPDFTFEKAKDGITQVLTTSQTKYNTLFSQIYQKWLHIAKNPEKTPQGVRKCEPLPHVNKQSAERAYAYEYASLEIQALYMKAFINQGKLQEGENPDLFQGVLSLEGAKGYRQQNYQMPRLVKDTIVPEDCIEDMKTRNPFIQQQDFNELRSLYGEDKVLDTKDERLSHHALQQEGALKTLRGAQSDKKDKTSQTRSPRIATKGRN